MFPALWPQCERVKHKDYLQGSWPYSILLHRRHFACHSIQVVWGNHCTTDISALVSDDAYGDIAIEFDLVLHGFAMLRAVIAGGATTFPVLDPVQYCAIGMHDKVVQ